MHHPPVSELQTEFHLIKAAKPEQTHPKYLHGWTSRRVSEKIHFSSNLEEQCL